MPDSIPRWPRRATLAALGLALLPTFAGAQSPVGFPRLRFPMPLRGVDALRAYGSQLESVAAWYRLPLRQLEDNLRLDDSLVADREGRLTYVCPFPLPEPPQDSAFVPLAPQKRGPYPAGQTFLLHSRPGATRVIYLDFDGHTTSGTPWNSNYNNGQSIVSAPWDIDNAPLVFSATETDRIQYIWQRVAEDFAPFDVDVTTQDPGVDALRKTTSTDTAYGIRVVISPTSAWFPGAGGVAYLNSFTWNSDTPCYAFSSNLADGEKYIAEAVSHEVGHTLALSHDGVSGGAAYYTGHGDWAPIMGVGYYKGVTQWSKGEYSLANNLQDDLAVMTASGIAYRTDDHGGTQATATVVTGSAVSVAGVIERNTDVDFFKLATGAGAISLTLTPAPRGPNLDVLAELTDNAGNVVATSNPTGLAASLTPTLTAGIYYLKIKGTGTGDPATGYSPYASLGQYTVNGNLIPTGANVPPNAAASATPSSGYAPLAVTFSSSGSNDPDGTIASYAWEFGDGTTSTAANPTKTYNKAGSYSAKLTVKDNKGATGTRTVALQVNQNPDKVLHIATIAMTLVAATSGNQAKGTVSVVDARGVAVGGVSVTATWSGLASGTVTKTTDGAGRASFLSTASAASGNFILTVNAVSKGGGFAYDPTKNSESADQIANP